MVLVGLEDTEVGGSGGLDLCFDFVDSRAEWRQVHDEREGHVSNHKRLWLRADTLSEQWYLTCCQDNGQRLKW